MDDPGNFKKITARFTKRNLTPFLDGRKKQRWTRRLILEQLEIRLAFSGLVGDPTTDDAAAEQSMFHAVIVAGESPDSPTLRVDSNTTISEFDGVGSLTIATRRGNYICTGTPIDATHIVTAAHCIDLNNDGQSNTRDGITSITFNLNYGKNYSSQIKASSWVTHPNFTGFNRPSINDDIAILKLSIPIPDAVPRYGLFTGDLSGQTIHLVGYGQSGNGINGYTVNASYTVKRYGQNVVDGFYTQDDSSQAAAKEVFLFDFDRANGTTGPLGGPSLGNLVETTLGGGDSGGPSFILSEGKYLLAGVNTFTQSTQTASAPKFGSMGGGMSIPAYASWIQQVIGGATTLQSASTGGARNTAGTAIIQAIRGDSTEFANLPMVLRSEPFTVATPVCSEAPTWGRNPDKKDVTQVEVLVRHTLLAIPSELISEHSTILEFSTSSQESYLDDEREFDRLKALDAYHADYSNSQI